MLKPRCLFPSQVFAKHLSPETQISPRNPSLQAVGRYFALASECLYSIEMQADLATSHFGNRAEPGPG